VGEKERTQNKSSNILPSIATLTFSKYGRLGGLSELNILAKFHENPPQNVGDIFS